MAKAANVSTGTVSRVLNNRERVHPDTRERVLNLAREIGLTPQATVRNREVAIVTAPEFPDRQTGYSAKMASVLAYALSEKRIGVLLPSDPERLLPDYYLDGVIAVTYSTRLLEMLERLEQRMPVVYIDYFLGKTEKATVNSDHRASGYIAARHFIERGKSKLGFISRDLEPFRERLVGYRDAIQDAGQTPNEKLLFLGDEKTNIFTMITRAVRNGADALFIPGTSMQAVQGMHVLQYVMGKRIPEDVAIIGSESEAVSEFMTPPMTTVYEPLIDMAKAASTMMHDLCEGKTVSQRQRVIPVNLVERESV
ncbi:LacI family DNA-binding transcriptional regulator [Cerasicoccus frondis]|uniref:LacI family DNA-binding transcriptional regulator n=1 Tax=Cerasicoccus frondis TaxID=490090 RepID=UPI002852D839|nr:LacI family DNA-binding transcriptional regulator [Cerasicoccus frondis]